MQPTDLLLDTGKQLRSYEVLPTNSPRLPQRLLSIESSSFVALSVVSEEADASSPTAVLVVIHLSPLLIELFHGDELQVSLNERSLLHFESQEVVTTTGSVEETSRKLENDKDVDAEVEDVDRHHGKVVVDYGEDGEMMNSCYCIGGGGEFSCWSPLVTLHLSHSTVAIRYDDVMM